MGEPLRAQVQFEPAYESLMMLGLEYPVGVRLIFINSQQNRIAKLGQTRTRCRGDNSVQRRIRIKL
jgi:hypothetical protein